MDVLTRNLVANSFLRMYFSRVILGSFLRFNSKSTAKSIESYLHKQYCEHRVRGEFFDLSDTILNEIIK